MIISSGNNGEAQFFFLRSYIRFLKQDCYYCTITHDAFAISILFYNRLDVSSNEYFPLVNIRFFTDFIKAFYFLQ